jgi:hypothetical protein
MGRRDEAGAVTAETAMALPLIAVFTLSLAWLVTIGITEVRALDAARETARAAARSDGSGEATSLGRRVAPDGSRISISRSGGAVVARVSSPVNGPAGLFGRWAGFRVSAEAVAAEEPSW